MKKISANKTYIFYMIRTLCALIANAFITILVFLFDFWYFVVLKNGSVIFLLIISLLFSGLNLLLLVLLSINKYLSKKLSAIILIANIIYRLIYLGLIVYLVGHTTKNIPFILFEVIMSIPYLTGSVIGYAKAVKVNTQDGSVCSD